LRSPAARMTRLSRRGHGSREGAPAQLPAFTARTNRGKNLRSERPLAPQDRINIPIPHPTTPAARPSVPMKENRIATGAVSKENEKEDLDGGRAGRPSREPVLLYPHRPHTDERSHRARHPRQTPSASALRLTSRHVLPREYLGSTLRKLPLSDASARQARPPMYG